MRIRPFLKGLAAVIGAAALCLTTIPLTAQKPLVYKVDPFWPKPLPNKWSMQQIVDIYIDKDDHIWIINRQTDARPDETGAATNHNIECCVPGPEIIQFDQQGNVLKSWDGKGTQGWPGRLQTLGVDRNLNIYVSGTTP